MTRRLTYLGHTWIVETTGISSHEGRPQLGLWFHDEHGKRLLGGVPGEALEDVSEADLTRALKRALAGPKRLGSKE